MNEANRILEEYRRRDRDLSPDFYALSRPANRFLHETRFHGAVRVLQRRGIESLQDHDVLEVGCGSGEWLQDLVALGARPERLSAIELGAERAHAAQRRIPGADVRVGDASRLPWSAEAFDVVLQSTVFTSILDDAMRFTVAREMARVLRRSGLILWFDFTVNNPRNPSVRGVDARAVRALFPGFELAHERIILAPPLARLIVPHAPRLASALQRIPFLRTHLIGTLTRVGHGPPSAGAR